MQQAIFHQYLYLLQIYTPDESVFVQVALLEVDRTEEFAPIKNASGEAVPDTAETARDLVLALQKRISSTSQLSKQGAGLSEDNQILTLLQAYVGGGI